MPEGLLILLSSKQGFSVIRKIVVASLLISLALTGCASTEDADYFKIRENRVGQHRDKLISEIGEPTIQLYAPHIELIRYVYMNQEDADDCIDIYVVERASGSIVEYICQ